MANKDTDIIYKKSASQQLISKKNGSKILTKNGKVYKKIIG